MFQSISTPTEFDKEVLGHPGQVLVDFWAPWCGPCQMLSPVMEELSQSLPDLKIVKINVDEQPEIPSRYSVTSLPTVLVVDNGSVKDSLVGFHQKQDYLTALTK